jgi:hypothetical protein
VDPQVVRYSERPELWDSIGDLSGEVWPEYNLHGEVLNYYWAQLYDVFPEWQFVLYDPGEQMVLAEVRAASGLAPDGREGGRERRAGSAPDRARQDTRVHTVINAFNRLGVTSRKPLPSAAT